MADDDTPSTTRAPILTKQAKYAWGDFQVETIEGARTAMVISRTNSFKQQDERSTRTVLEIEIEDAPDVIRLMQHALDSREERT